MLASASPDLLREMIRCFAQAVMDAVAEMACGAGYGPTDGRPPWAGRGLTGLLRHVRE